VYRNSWTLVNDHSDSLILVHSTDLMSISQVFDDEDFKNTRTVNSFDAVQLDI